jgi:hypothetical protein
MLFHDLRTYRIAEGGLKNSIFTTMYIIKYWTIFTRTEDILRDIDVSAIV